MVLLRFIYLVGVSFPFCVLLAFELLADAVDGDADTDMGGEAGVADDVEAAAAAAAALLRDVIGEMTADLPPGLIVLLRWCGAPIVLANSAN